MNDAEFALAQEALAALESATLDADLGGTGYVRITCLYDESGKKITVERLDPMTVMVEVEHEPGDRAVAENFE